MSFKENINRICRKRRTNLTAVVKQVKGSSSFTSAINKGSLPKEDEMVQMAKILHCSVIDFFMDEEDLAPQNESQNEDEADILRVYRSLSRRAKHKFMSMVYEFEHREELEVDKESSTHREGNPHRTAQA